MKKEKTHLRHIVAVSNNKGGAGKTTTVLNLAAAILKRGYLGWDMRREGVKTQPMEPTIFNAICEGMRIPVYRNSIGLYYTPSSRRMEDADVHLNSTAVTDPVRALRGLFSEPIDDHTGEGLSEWENSFDFILIDTQPAMSRVTVNAICAADGIIIPVELEQYAVDGYLETIKKIIKIKKLSNPTLQIHGVLITKKNSRLKNARIWEEDLREQGDVFTTTIRRANDISSSQDRSFDSAPGVCHDIFSYRNGRCNVTDDFILLADEYLRKWG